MRVESPIIVGTSGSGSGNTGEVAYWSSNTNLTGIPGSVVGVAGTGTNGAATARIVVAQLSTGNAAPAAITFAGGAVGASGATPQTLTNLVSIRGAAALATGAELVFLLGTARIIGGSTNGLAIRNSGNTRDNFLIDDSGGFGRITNGTNTMQFGVTAATGEIPAGGFVNGVTTNNMSLSGSNTGNSASKVVIAYFDQTQYWSALEIPNTASGKSTLSLMKSGGPIVQNGAIAGDANSYTTFDKTVTAIPDNTITSVLTVTCPNTAQAAFLRVLMVASLGAGGAIGADEATAITSFDIAITRVAGVAVARNNAAATVTTTAVAGATTITLTPATGAVSGGVGASNTFDVRVTIARGGGSSTNHVCMVRVQIMNVNGTGITVA